MSMTRRMLFAAGAAFPLGIAPERTEVINIATPPMFYVYRFNYALRDYEMIGAYSKREEAETFLATINDKSKGILQMTWRDLVDMVTTTRLGDIAEVLREREHKDLGI